MTYIYKFQVSTFLWGLIRRERREGKEGKEASCKEEQNESKYFRSNCFLQPLVELFVSVIEHNILIRVGSSIYSKYGASLISII